MHEYAYEKEQKDGFNNHDCLPILMFLDIMLCIMLTYLMLHSPLSNAVCCIMLFFFYFFAIEFCKCFLFPCLVLVYLHIACLFKYYFVSCAVLLICLYFLILCSHRLSLFFIGKGYVLSGDIAIENNHYYYYIRRDERRVSEGCGD